MSAAYRINLHLSVQPESPSSPRRLPERLIELVRETTKLWGPARFEALVLSGEVPAAYLEVALAFVLDNPHLSSIQPEDFLRAAEIARPDLYPVLSSPEGQRWFTRASDELGRLVARRLLGMMFGRGG